MSTALSTVLVWYFFIPPQFSFQLTGPMALVSIAMFLGMGVLFSLSHERLRNANRQAAEALELANDANRQLQSANGEITRLYEKTLEIERLKTQFFANVSHELRTPLTLILGPVAKRLAAAELTDDERNDLDVVDRNARLLYRHVSDLLDVAKLEAGRMQMQYSQVDMAHVTRFLASHFDVLAGEKRINFRIEAPDVLPAQLDVEKYRRILLNLLSNAFKFTPNGGVVALTLAVVGDDAVVVVQDSGPGVPPELREAVFEPFRQADGGSDRAFGGTGLGLAIVKEFTHLHRGTVKITEAAGGGALFTVTLPLAAPADTKVLPAPTALEEEDASAFQDELRTRPGGMAADIHAAGPDAPLVLVVEDNPDMNAFVANSLAGLYRVATAFDGREGLDKALAMRPDLIISDVMMPRMSGDAMVRALRANRDMDKTAIVMLTARPMRRPA